jgi:hypothetical protein
MLRDRLPAVHPGSVSHEAALGATAAAWVSANALKSEPVLRNSGAETSPAALHAAQQSVRKAGDNLWSIG